MSGYIGENVKDGKVVLEMEIPKDWLTGWSGRGPTEGLSVGARMVYKAMKANPGRYSPGYMLKKLIMETPPDNRRTKKSAESEVAMHRIMRMRMHRHNGADEYPLPEGAQLPYIADYRWCSRNGAYYPFLIKNTRGDVKLYEISAGELFRVILAIIHERGY